MALKKFTAVAYDNVADEVVENATGGFAHASVEDTTPIQVYDSAGNPLGEVSSNASGIVEFYLQDRVDCFVTFTGRPPIHVLSPSAIVEALEAAQAASQRPAVYYDDAADAWPPRPTDLPVTWWSPLSPDALPPSEAVAGDTWKRRVA